MEIIDESGLDWTPTQIAANLSQEAANPAKEPTFFGREANGLQARRDLEHANQADVWFVTGKKLLAEQRIPQAIKAFRIAMRLDPASLKVRAGLAAVLNAFGIQSKAASNFTQAVEAYRQALTLTPDQAAIWSNLGNALRHNAQELIGQRPAKSSADVCADTIERAAKLLHEAVQCHRRAVALDPGLPILTANLAGALNALGIVSRLSGRTQQAVIYHRECVALSPQHAGYWGSLGNALKDMKHFGSAIAAQKQAMVHEPASATHVYNLGIAHAAASQPLQAIACFDEVLAREPENHNARWDRALSCLKVGDFGKGWPDYEARFAIGKLPERHPSGRLWRGQAYKGQRLLLLSEQGLGDAIWAARFLAQVKELGGFLILEARAELCDLFASMGIADEIIVKGAILPQVDWHAHICSLPGLFARSLDDVSGKPYLKAHSGQTASAASVVRKTKGRLKVGIVWSGSTTFSANRDRKAHLADFLSAVLLPGVQLFSLQKGLPERELDNVPGDVVTKLGPMLQTFADTSAAMNELDLIVMTDSAVAHLAGAMGKPVWVLLNREPYWMWQEEKTRTLWYNSVRLFRMDNWSNWHGVFDRVSTCLSECLNI